MKPVGALFVYYKLPRAQRAQWLARVHAFRTAVQARWPGLAVELMQRPEADAQDRETWMEVHRHPDGLPPGLAEALAEMAAGASLPAGRATEVFEPLDIPPDP